MVSRPRLIERLNEGLHRKLTLVSAPAGFGKTTLLSEWVRAIVGARHAELPYAAPLADAPHALPLRVVWLSLDDGDNDPVRFLNYLIAALQQVDASIGKTVQRILQSPQLLPAQSLVTPLINDITTSAMALVLVLDDYHHISSLPVHQVVQFLLEHHPPLLHLVISTREDPPLPLPRLRARGQVTELRERGLRFTAEEASTFLAQTMGLHLSAEVVAALEARTEGWIAGLQLAGLALHEDPENAEAFVATFTGDDRYIMDYLVAEVLQRQPEATRDFLRQTAVLDRLTAPLCDAVTGREDSQVVLDQLEGANLFLIPLDRRREWYRYHHLFAEFLCSTLEQEEQKPLHQRAMRWFEAHGLMSQAIRHAIAGASVSGDWEDAERLVRLVAEETIYGGGLLTVLS